MPIWHIQVMDIEERSAALRIIDANLNRASEGLRVVEDMVRLDLEDRYLTEVCKSIRHELADAMSCFSAESLHAARDTRGDIGTQTGLPQEYARCSAAAIRTANLKRVQQSLRCLEEQAKLLHPPAAVPIEQLRYRVYTLEKAISLTAGSSRSLAGVALYVLVDGRQSNRQFVDLVDILIHAGVHAIQLRDKTLEDRELLERARLLRDRIDRHSTDTGNPSSASPLFVMNDRPDIAVLSRADGVHVGQDELGVSEVRRIVGPRLLVGVSTHSLQQARQAVLDGANYIGVGPTFPSSTKDFQEFTGLTLLRQVVEEISLPAFAIGGITLDNLTDVLSTDCHRVALSHAIVEANAPGDVIQQFLQNLAAAERTDSDRGLPTQQTSES